MKLVLISDDLTGALDAAVVFAVRGLRTLVAISNDYFAEALESDADIVAVSLNTREGSEINAIRKTETVARQVPSSVAIFKKIDSRMKGHVRAEIQALKKAIGAQNIVVCPAIPSMNRLVTNGMASGYGIAEPIDLAHFCKQAEGGHSWSIPDARNDEDLDAIVSNAAPMTLLCGARGLAEAIARKLEPSVLPSELGNDHLPHPILFAIGSRDPITLSQVKALRDFAPKIAYAEAANGSVDHPLPPDGNLILQAIQGAQEIPSEIVTRNFAHSIASLAASGKSTLILTGGETAAAALSDLGFGILEIVGEPQAGIPVSVPLGKERPVIVTKSGGLGTSDSLIRLAGPGYNNKA